MTKAPHRNGRHPRPDRDLIRRAFVEAPQGPGEPTIAGLALEHGRSPKALQAVAAKEGWVRLRAEHRRRLESIRQRTLLQEAAEAVAEFDSQSIQIAKAALGRVARFLTDEGAPGVDRNGRPVPGRGLKPSDLQDIADAVRTLQQVVHAAAGTPDERPDPAETGVNQPVTWADVMRYADRVPPPALEHDPDEGGTKKRRRLN